MKILHTSDWHLGHTLYNHDRTEEQMAMLEQMVNLVSKHQPDVFLLCGDVYHTPQPSAFVQTMFANAMMNIHNANPNMTIVITAGNHDSGAKHDIFHEPWKALNVYTIGNLARDAQEDHIIYIPNKGYIVALPYTHERNMPDGFIQDILDRVSSLNKQQLPIIMMAHTTVKGCDYTGHDQNYENTIGGIETLDIEQLGTGYDYLALGHIHRAQFIHTGKHNVRYCGTPLPVSFDEDFAHTVSIVEIHTHGETPIVTTEDILNPHPLVTLPTQGATNWEKAQELLQQFPNDIPAYIRLNVELEGFLPAEANAEAHKLTEGKQCHFCHINIQKHSTQHAEDKILSVQEFQSEHPLDIAQRYAEDMGKPFDEEMKRMFTETLAMIENDTRNQ